jgi:hypothetical protein
MVWTTPLSSVALTEEWTVLCWWGVEEDLRGLEFTGGCTRVKVRL